ncbi:MAG: hypothetical protein ACR2MD_18160 [Aridibacter sp.]
MKKSIKTISAFALVATLFTVALAGINIDDEGKGFVGKGDVQLAFGWNNAALQANADIVSFALETHSSTVTEVTWVCTKDNGNTQERARITTTESSSGGVVSALARLKNQISGFNLLGFVNPNTTPTTSTSTEGPAVSSCPTNWVASSTSAPETISSSSNRTLTISAPGYLDKVIELDAN